MIGNEPVKSISGGIFMVENKYYERKIKYLDLMESGERAGGAGFIKIEVRGMEINLTVIVKGLHPTDTYERDVVLQAGDEEFVIGRIPLKEGRGEFKHRTVMDHSQLQGIRIALGGTREICCKWQEQKSTSRMRGSDEKRGAVKESTVRENVEWEKAAGERVTGKSALRERAARERVVGESAARESTVGASIVGESTAGESVVRENAVGKSVVREDAAGESAVKEDGARENAALKSSAQENGSKDHGASGGAAEAVKEEKQNREKKSQEIQLIPWDEIKAVEESLEKVDKIMAKPAENRPWKTAERDAENRVSERAAKGITERERRVRERERRTAETEGRQERSGESLIKTVDSLKRQEKRPVRLMEDKWQQLWAIYPHIRPFQDEREYLSIGPADFVLLPEQAYRAANNSFLLHGYYNYDHLILTKIEKRGEVFYYIGVPGNYYEREKQVAVMFGFESFECGTEPAQAGDFGYYMMRTQL